MEGPLRWLKHMISVAPLSGSWQVAGGTTRPSSASRTPTPGVGTLAGGSGTPGTPPCTSSRSTVSGRSWICYIHNSLWIVKIISNDHDCSRRVDNWHSREELKWNGVLFQLPASNLCVLWDNPFWNSFCLMGKVSAFVRMISPAIVFTKREQCQRTNSNHWSWRRFYSRNCCNLPFNASLSKVLAFHLRESFWNFTLKRHWNDFSSGQSMFHL